MGADKTRKRHHADDGHQPKSRAKRPRDKPSDTSGNSDELESHLRGGDGSEAGSEEASGPPADGSASNTNNNNNNKDIYYLFASDTIVCGIAEALQIPESILQNFPAATQSDRRYGNHVVKTLDSLEMRAAPPEPLVQIVRSFIQHPTDDDADTSFATAWILLQAQREHYATQFSDILPGEDLDEEWTRALNTALANLQAMEVFGLLRCWEGFSSNLATRLDSDRQLRGVRMEWNRLQLLMDGYVLIHGSRPQSERDAIHGKAAQRARTAWIQEDSRWTFSTPPSSVHLVVGNEYGPPARVLFQQPPNRPHTTLDDPRTISPPHVRRTTTTSSSTGPRAQPIRRPLGTTGVQQLAGASTVHLEKMLVDLSQRVDNMGQRAQGEFDRLNRDIGGPVRRLAQDGIQQGQRDPRPPLPRPRRLSLSQLDEKGPSIPGQRPIPGPVRIFNAPGWIVGPEQSPDYGPSSSLSGPSQPNPGGASGQQQSPNYGPSSSLDASSQPNPQEFSGQQQSSTNDPSSSQSRASQSDTQQASGQQQSLANDPSSSQSQSSPANPQGASGQEQSSTYDPASGLGFSSQLEPQGASTPKVFPWHRGGGHPAPGEADTSEGGPSGTQ